MIYDCKDYRDYLLKVFKTRKKKNPAYSISAYASALGIPKSTLASVLKKNRHISIDAIPGLIKALKLSKQMGRHFTLLVEGGRAKSGSRRSELQSQIRSSAQLARRIALKEDGATILNSWYVLPLLELGNLTEFKLTAQSASKYLEIKIEDAERAIRYLQEQGALETSDGKVFHKKASGILVSSSTENFNLRKFHEEMLEKTKTTLSQHSPSERFIGSEIFGFNQEQLEQAAEIIEDCFARVVALANKADSRKDLYYLGIQMVRLSSGKISND